jgi:hypothetical protein
MPTSELKSTLLSVTGELLIVGCQSGYFVEGSGTTVDILIAEHTPVAAHPTEPTP